MKYMFLIYSNEATPLDETEMQGYGKFWDTVGARGIIRGGNRLRPTADARTVRVPNGKASVSDGPFAETKEQLGGYYILDCTDLDDAIALAAQIPNAKDGSVEVRPVREMM